MQKSILFLGDSFTWGEGLELYCDTPKWITEREKENSWMVLAGKQDDDSISFRRENRFANLVANHYNKTALVSSENGGCVASNIVVAEKFLFDPDVYVDTIIIQFSILDREPWHGTFECNCSICKETGYNRLFADTEKIINKIVNNIELDDLQKQTLHFYESMVKLKITDNGFLDELIDLKENWYRDLLSNFYYNNIQKWQAGGKRKIYYLDSWDKKSSNSLFRSAIPMQSNGIHLIGKDNRKYVRWTSWADSFEFKSIVQQFPYTHNSHPTLEQHQYLAKSIIQFIDKKNSEEELIYD